MIHDTPCGAMPRWVVVSLATPSVRRTPRPQLSARRSVSAGRRNICRRFCGAPATWPSCGSCRAGDAKILMNGYVARALLEQAENQPEAAMATIGRAAQVFGSTHEAAIRAWLALRQGNLSAARRWADESGLGADDAPEAIKGDVQQITYGRVLIASGQVAAGVQYLERLLAAAEANGRDARTIELLTILAMTQHARGERPQAIAMLQRALDLAEPEGFVRILVDEGPALAPL